MRDKLSLCKLFSAAE